MSLHAPSAPQPPTLVLLPGSRYWHAKVDDEVLVRLQFSPNVKIEVAIWWNRRDGLPDVKLVFGLYADAVELGSLTGNGFDAPALHRIGFGTFAVNIAVQALWAVYPPTVRIHGLLFNTAEQQLGVHERMRLEAGRRAFWRRFGLEIVTAGDPPLDYLEGKVGGLRVVTSGRLAGQFPRYLDLRQFHADAAPTTTQAASD